MWLLSSLILILFAVGIIEHVLWRRRVALESAEEAERLQLLRLLLSMTDLTEDLYLATSHIGVEYPPENRKVIANAIGQTRKILARQGLQPRLRSPVSGAGSWPYKDGKLVP